MGQGGIIHRFRNLSPGDVYNCHHQQGSLTVAIQISANPQMNIWH